MRSTERPVRLSNAEVIGSIAAAALRQGGTSREVRRLTGSAYWMVGGELVWLGREPGELHPRAVRGDKSALSPSSAKVWSPRRAALVGSLRAIRRVLRLALASDIGAPKGLGRLLRGRAPEAPFDRALPLIGSFARACDTDDAESAVAAGRALLGLGPGLTPSGDDFIGGALFAKGALRRGKLAPVTWTKTAKDLVGAAAHRTTRLSAVLFGDLAAGRSFAPLHDLTLALNRSDAISAARALRRLVAIGYSSGWDMATGFAVGILGASMVTRRRG